MIYRNKVTPEFVAELTAIGKRLGVDPDFIMAAIAFETGGRFSADVKNKMSGATGLIQFMPNTAIKLGTTTQKLAAMTATDQLRYVELYFKQWTNIFKKLPRVTIQDVYMSILWPKAIGKDLDYVLFRDGDGTKTYFQNKGLDTNLDGTITKGEACTKVLALYEKGVAA